MGIIYQSLLLLSMQVMCAMLKDIEMHLPSSIPIEGHIVYVEEGASLTVTCSVNDVTMWNSSQIYFFVSNNTKYNPRQEHVTIYNHSTAMLSIPALSVDGYKERHEVICCLDIQKCSVIDSFLNSDQVVYYDLNVGRKPAPARFTNTSCVVENYEYLYCSWEPNYLEQENHTNLGGTKHYIQSSVKWQVLRDGVVTKESTEIVNHTNEFTLKTIQGFNYDPSLLYRVQVITSNIFGVVTSQWKQFLLKDIVRPGPVTNIRRGQLSGLGDQVTLSWTIPKTDRLVTSIINYRSEWDSPGYFKTLKVMRGVDATALTVLPNTKYELNITLRLGYDGPPSSYTFKSEATAPKHNPELNPLGFELLKGRIDCRAYQEHCLKTQDLGCDVTDSQTCAHVILHWKAIPASHYCGEGFKYKLVKSLQPTAPHSEAEVVIDVPSYLTWIVIPVSSSEPLKLSVLSYNNLGLSPGPVTHVSIPRADTVMAGHVNPRIIPKHNDDVEVTWDAASEGHVTYVVFWCKGIVEKQQCMGTLHWSEPTPNTSLTIQPLDGTHHGYIFGVAINSVLHAQGIQWAHCRYDHNKEPGIPVIEFAPSQEVNKISFGVGDAECFTIAYMVYYCEESGCESWKRTDFNITNRGSWLSLSDLRGGVTYRLKVKAVSFSGLVSPFSNEEIVLVKKHWATGAAVFGITLVLLVCVFFFITGLYFCVVKPRLVASFSIMTFLLLVFKAES